MGGFRHGTRNKFSKAYRTKGEPNTSRWLTTFKRGDMVGVKVDPSIQKGMPHSFYHGKTGIVFNVNKNAVGVELPKVVGNRQLRKRMHINTLHLRKSRCQEEFKIRLKENDAKRREAAAKGEKICLKRQPEGPKPMKIVEAKEEDVEVMV